MKDLARFTDSFAGEVVRPGDPGYDAARVVWNGMVDRHPALIVRPTRHRGVSTGDPLCPRTRAHVAVRCGGHSIPGLSTCDDGIRRRPLPHGGPASIRRRGSHVWGGGALLRELDDAAQAARPRVPRRCRLAHRCRRFDARRRDRPPATSEFGLTIDNLRGGRLVTAGGQLAARAPTEHRTLLGPARRRRELRYATASSSGCSRSKAASPTVSSCIRPSAAEALAERYRDSSSRGQTSSRPCSASGSRCRRGLSAGAGRGTRWRTSRCSTRGMLMTLNAT